MKLLAVVVGVVVDICYLARFAREREVCWIMPLRSGVLRLVLLVDHFEFISYRMLRLLKLFFSNYI